MVVAITALAFTSQWEAATLDQAATLAWEEASMAPTAFTDLPAFMDPAIMPLTQETAVVVDLVAILEVEEVT